MDIQFAILEMIRLISHECFLHICSCSRYNDKVLLCDHDIVLKLYLCRQHKLIQLHSQRLFALQHINEHEMHVIYYYEQTAPNI